MKTNTSVIIMRTLWITYRPELEVCLGVMLCVSLRARLSKAWCVGATGHMHRIHAVCVLKGVWNSCWETQRSSLLCPGSLWSDNSYLSTLAHSSFLSALLFLLSYPLLAQLFSIVLASNVKTIFYMIESPSLCNVSKAQSNMIIKMIPFSQNFPEVKVTAVCREL